MQRSQPALLQRFFDGVGDGLHLWRAVSGAQQETIGESSQSGQVQQGYRAGFLVLRGLDGEAQFGANGLRGQV